MSDADIPRKPNYLRRVVVVSICLSPVLLLIASLVVSAFAPRESGLGLGLVACALFPTALNVYLSVIRPTFYRWWNGSDEGFRYISGVPLFGTLFVVTAGIVGFGDWRVATVGLMIAVFDFGGLPWVLVALWRDRSFWDA